MTSQHVFSDRGWNRWWICHFNFRDCNSQFDR
jgi:hypothetical protein